MNFINIFIGILALSFAFSAAAVPIDYQQPVEVTSSRWTADIDSQNTTFYGPVKITQGSITINADHLTVESAEAAGTQIMIATGEPATYSQRMENGKLATAQANEIRYQVHQKMLTMTGNAQLSQAGSVVKGQKISYDLVGQQLIAEGSQQQQVTTIFLPADIEQLESDKTP